MAQSDVALGSRQRRSVYNRHCPFRFVHPEVQKAVLAAKFGPEARFIAAVSEGILLTPFLQVPRYRVTS